jgi:cell wall-associated NlpC family hydrolase
MTIGLPLSLRDWFVWWVLQQYGKPYLWGGDDPIKGFDCSGMVIEGLVEVGLFKRGYDSTAAGLYAYFDGKGRTLTNGHKQPGCLVFFSKTDAAAIHHVEIVLNNGLSIGASGRGSKTTDLDQAIAQNAFVKIGPIERGLSAFYADPFM